MCYRVDVIEERRSVIPRLLDIAREVGQPEGRTSVQGGQPVGQSHNAVVDQSRLGLYIDRREQTKEVEVMRATGERETLPGKHTWIMFDLLRMLWPMGWNFSMSLSRLRVKLVSASTMRNAEMLTKLYLKSSKSNVSKSFFFWG